MRVTYAIHGVLGNIVATDSHEHVFEASKWGVWPPISHMLSHDSYIIGNVIGMRHKFRAEKIKLDVNHAMRYHDTYYAGHDDMRTLWENPEAWRTEWETRENNLPKKGRDRLGVDEGPLDMRWTLSSIELTEAGANSVIKTSWEKEPHRLYTLIGQIEEAQQGFVWRLTWGAGCSLRFKFYAAGDGVVSKCFQWQMPANQILHAVDKLITHPMAFCHLHDVNYALLYGREFGHVS
jgi:hypothetical protein